MNTFLEIINSETPVFIYFFASWCAPCKAMTPTIESIAREVQGRARVLKIDVDKNQSLASALHIQSVPTLIIYKNGVIVWRHSGGLDKLALKNKLLSFT